LGVLYCVCWYTVTGITNDRTSFNLKANGFIETSVTLRLSQNRRRLNSSPCYLQKSVWSQLNKVRLEVLFLHLVGICAVE